MELKATGLFEAHCSAESLLKIFAFVWTSVTNLLSIERGGVIGIFIVIKSFKN